MTPSGHQYFSHFCLFKFFYSASQFRLIVLKFNKSHTYFIFSHFLLESMKRFGMQYFSCLHCGGVEVWWNPVCGKPMFHSVFSHGCCSGVSSASPFSLMSTIFSWALKSFAHVVLELLLCAHISICTEYRVHLSAYASLNKFVRPLTPAQWKV